MANSSKSIFSLVIVAAIAAAVGIAVQNWQSSSPVNPTMKKAILLPQPRTLQAAEFIDQSGNEFQSEQFKGQWDILFFGFTHCPDICPTTLYQLKKVKEALQAKNNWGNLRVTMITVDPARDTPERLAKYVPFFDPDFVGLTGEVSTITEFAKSVGVLFVTHEPDENGNYDVDHTAALILLNPDGQFAGVISAPHSHDELVHDLAALSQSKTKTDEQAGGKMSATLELERLWIRPAPPAADSLAAYLTAKNRGDESVVIIGASSPMFEEVMIHTTSVDSNMASMDMVDRLTITPKSTIKFAPMGTHLMLMNPVTDIAADDLIPITLEMADGSTLQALFKVGVPADE